MPERRRGAVVAVSAALVLLVVVGSAPGRAVAQEAPAGVDLGAYAGPLRFEAPDGTAIAVGGDLDGRYAGTIEIRLGGDGDLTLVDELSMGAYVEGIAEVPARWPDEALRAQAVAARTYAWYVMRRNSYDGYDICATVACQVFHGREVVEGPLGDRWAAAVSATAGEVLVEDDAPILARYFSTSGGSTRDNEDVFPGEEPRRYLRGVPDPEDAGAPLHQWQVRFTRDELDRIVGASDELADGAPVADLAFIEASDDQPDRVRLTSTGGRSVTVTSSRFRFAVSDVAPDLFPERFPSVRPDGRRLPMTLPSSRLSFELTDDEVVVEGRGFGHGVGMSQYGAKGKAEAGFGYADILAAYYGGIRPTAHPALPDVVRVGADTDGQAYTLRADAPVRVLAGERVVTERGLGTWTVRRRPDRTMQLLAPPGYGAPLVVEPTSVADAEPFEVQVVDLETVVNKPAELALVVTDGSADPVDVRPLGVVDPGRHTVPWDLDGASGSLAPGTYEVALRATDEEGATEGASTPVVVRPATAGTPLASVLGPAPSAASSPVPSVLAGLAGLVLGVLAGSRRWSR